MRLTIGALSRLSCVSIRALHHYDQIGLLRPSEVATTGYRFYDDASIERLWQILFFRELDFPLGDIAAILSSPGFDRMHALEEHRMLLLQKRERLDNLISLVSNAIKGETTMEFKPFDTSKFDAMREEYAAEAKERWGDTDAYRESARRTAKYSKEDYKRLEAEAGEIFAAFGALVGTDPADERVQALVKRWQAHITANYYTCTDEILAGLGQMYMLDERFAQNIDQHGAGAAKLMSAAIAVYCAN